MKINMKIILVIILIFGICGIIALTGFLSGSGNGGNEKSTIPNTTMTTGTPEKDLPHIIRTTGFFPVNATIYQNAGSLLVYQGILEKNGSINLKIHPIFGERQNVTTEQEAPAIAKTILDSYGGVPSDAVYDGASMTYTEYFDNGTFTQKVPEFTTVFYSQNINRMPVLGDSNVIKLTLGTDGELLWIFKVWRNYTPTGEVPLISIDDAIDRLERQELLETTWSPVEGNVTIDSIGQGYYANDINDSAAILEPLWMMYGTGASGSRLGFYVYARQFANFTASPTVESPSEEVLFSDRSDASPTRWFWDFGDGTNSTHRNPKHAYKNPGNYTITLTVWNDIGSDTLVKSDYITVLPAKMTDTGSGIIAGNT
ncbi:MAG: PKD domain-containing protein [Methanoregula sp.]